MNTHALILANGEPPTKKLLRTLRASATMFVCADGGANAAARHNMKPDAIVGDMTPFNRKLSGNFAAQPSTRSLMTIQRTWKRRSPGSQIRKFRILSSLARQAGASTISSETSAQWLNSRRRLLSASSMTRENGYLPIIPSTPISPSAQLCH